LGKGLWVILDTPPPGGVASGGSWTAARRSPDKTQALLDQQWVEGFTTALSWQSGSGYALGDPMKGVPDREAIHAWIDNYCRSRPVDRIVNAVSAFANERWRVIQSTAAPN
jgi:hypothetical protein